MLEWCKQRVYYRSLHSRDVKRVSSRESCTCNLGLLSFTDSCELRAGMFIIWGGGFFGNRILCLLLLYLVRVSDLFCLESIWLDLASCGLV